MTMNFERVAPPVGSRIVIAGGCGGIGRRLCDVALDLKLEVAVLDLPASLARHPPREGVTKIAFDAADDESVKNAFAEIDKTFGAIDSLINLVGFRNRLGRFDQIPMEEWDSVLSGNLRSALLINRYAMPGLLRAPSATVVHVASSMGLRAVPGHSPYAVSKAGILMLTQVLAMEVAPQIRVNAVAPSAVDTEFHRGGTGRPDHGDAGSDPSGYANGVPMGRIAVPEDIVGPILFLAGPLSAFITGQTLVINGGK